MGMGNCPKCWDHFCSCGYEYRKWGYERRVELASVALGVSMELLKDTLGRSIPSKHPKYEEE